MNIRIGNDIRLNLTLKGPKNYDSTNIKSLKCYFINTSLCDFCNPCCGELKGCGCGRPCYHVEPCNMCHCHKPCGHLKYPYAAMVSWTIVQSVIRMAVDSAIVATNAPSLLLTSDPDIVI